LVDTISTVPALDEDRAANSPTNARTGVRE
jgi:hypothetical protein